MLLEKQYVFLQNTCFLSTTSILLILQQKPQTHKQFHHHWTEEFQSFQMIPYLKN